MKYTKELLKNSKVKFIVELDEKEWEHQVKHAYEHEKGKYTVQGFRKGKAPKAVIEKNYGEGVFYEHALNHAFYDNYDEILRKEPDVEPIDNPSLDVQKIDKTGVIMVIEVNTKPEVKLGDYKGLEITVKKSTVTAAEVKAELLLAQEKASRLVSVDRSVKENDTVTFDFSGSIDGEKFPGGTAEKHDLVIGSKTFIPGFEEQMVGLKKGDEKDLNVKFPEDYHAEELKGKDSVFAVKIHDIREKELPELNDEFAATMSEFETLEDYKKDIKKTLKDKKEKENKLEAENTLIRTITENAEVEVPEVLVEDQINAFIKDYEYRLMYQGLKLDDYLKATNQTMESLKEARREDATKTVKTRMVLEAIVKAEKIEATPDELKEKIKVQATEANKSVEEYEKTLSRESLDYLINDLMVNKLLDFLKKENNL